MFFNFFKLFYKNKYTSLLIDLIESVLKLKNKSHIVTQRCLIYSARTALNFVSDSAQLISELFRTELGIVPLSLSLLFFIIPDSAEENYICEYEYFL